MWTTRKWLSTSVLAVLLCLSCALPGICYANPTYTISESELLTLSNHLDALEANNNLLKNLLSESDESLTIALNALMKSQAELAELRTQLEKARSETTSAQKSLETANQELQKAAQYFKECEREHAKTERRLTNQRNIWEALCFIAVGVAVAR